MRKELPHYRIGSSYGGNQEFFDGFMMKIGGCAAETAMECCIYLDKYCGTHLCPMDTAHITLDEYKKIAQIMKPYLHPRMSGIDKLSIYLEGFGAYLKERNCPLTLEGVEGDTDITEAKRLLVAQIENDLPVPYLCLNHNNRRFKEYEWHWFLINGYEQFEDKLMVKAVTYSTFEWLDFDELWNTQRSRKGGFILMRNSLP